MKTISISHAESNPSNAFETINKILHITIVGNKDDPDAQALYNAALHYPESQKKIEWQDESEKKVSANQFPMLNRAAAYVCAQGTCSLPALSVHELKSILDQLNSKAKVSYLANSSVGIKSSPSLQDSIMRQLKNQNAFLIIFGFLGMGLLLAFTPCVLPMLPILASIIVGEGKKITPYRAFTLSVTYVLAMAMTYALAGIIAAILGSYLQAYLQNPIILMLFSLVFVMLSLSLFGFYDLRLPHFFHQYIIKISNWYTNETYLGVAIMGSLATLIASPCVTAPLAGVLGYISQTGDAWFGGLALFVLGFGMGIPLIIVGTIGGKFLPKSGSWLNGVKAFFGLILLGVAIWLLQRILPSLLTMLLWSMLAMFTAVYMGAFDRIPASRIGKFWKGLSLIILAYGFALAIGGFMGNADPLHPLEIKQHAYSSSVPPSFQPIKDLSTLKKTLSWARQEQKITLLDFYAEWCISCKKIEMEVFHDPVVQAALAQVLLLRVDVTHHTEANIAIAKHFKVIGPPTILFFDKNGRELKPRIIGEVDAKTFLNVLQQIYTDQFKS